MMKIAESQSPGSILGGIATHYDSDVEIRTDLAVRKLVYQVSSLGGLVGSLMPLPIRSPTH
jgi:hypothetical protein